jgi:hypothetical protein
MKLARPFILLLAFSFSLFSQTRWIPFFSLEDKEINFYIGEIKSTKDFTTFAGKMEGPTQTAIHYFKADCTKKEMFVVGRDEKGKKVAFSPIKVELVERSAIEAAYEYVCGEEN